MDGKSKGQKEAQITKHSKDVLPHWILASDPLTHEGFNKRLSGTILLENKLTRHHFQQNRGMIPVPTDKDFNGQVRLSGPIVKALQEGRHLHLLIKNSDLRIRQDVDFSHELVREAFLTSPYEIMWQCHIPSHANDLVCLFPNHESRNDERAQLLYVRSYWSRSLANLNKDINQRFKASLDYTEQGGRTKFAVAYGAHVYVCTGITGNIYLLWAAHVNRTNHGNVPNTLYHDVPVVVNTNGRGSIIGLYILPPLVREEWDLMRIPITTDSPVFMMPKDADLFVCEVRDDTRPLESPSASAASGGADPIVLASTGQCLATRKEALARILATTPNLQKQEQHHRNASEDTSVDWEHAGHVDLELIRANNNNNNNTGGL